ncbi:DNA primase (plasmid) [Nostoc flagelliforme CCNUN1]|uniref:DNA primase n=1 Tax=Nostoc flagelliforme CCNUN1 TaxID=2038116 RepID=A0A2K8T6R9_9NOSO|nr:MobV family relaxase [Nostoc flagelliforme]AUB43396.1 DNA primase [Nostoc flagelliforme CCNUN1]
MAYAIASLKKLKFSNIAGSASHTSRERETPNADLSVENIRFIGSNDPESRLEDLVMAKINEVSQRRKIRTDGVYCVEMLLSASPSYFRPSCPNQGGYYEQNKLDIWLEATQQWLSEEYGSRIVRAELHLDEITPHVHAYFVPVDDDGQLRCKHFFGGRQKIQAFQDSYYETMRLIGLERGLRGSRAKHEDIKDFYRIVETGRNLEVSELNLEQIKAKAADRDRAARQLQQMEATATSLAQANELFQQRIAQLEEQKEKYRQQTQQLRDLALEDVAWELGLNFEPGQSNSWVGHGHIIDINGDKFQSASPGVEKGGGAIDLVIQVNNYNLRQGLAWLNDRFGESGAERAAIAAVLKQTADILQTELAPKFVPPVEDKSKWLAVHDYLTHLWGLPSNFVHGFHQSGLIYADKQQNAVFIMRDLNHQIKGAYLEGSEFKGLAIGSDRTKSWFHFQLGEPGTNKVEKAVLCSSTIDAFSKAMLEYSATGSIPKQRTLYMALVDPKSTPVERLEHIPQIKTAFNSDEFGEATALAVKKLLPHARRSRPKTVSWNQDLLLEKLPQQQQQRKSEADLSL